MSEVVSWRADSKNDDGRVSASVSETHISGIMSMSVYILGNCFIRRVNDLLCVVVI